MDSDFPQQMIPSIQEFFESEDAREPGLDLYEDVFNNPYFFPLQRKAELAKMVQTARKVNPRTIMEIGADKGGGLYHWCKCFPEVERVIACEIRGTPYSELFEEHFPQIEFLWLPCSSYDPKTLNRVYHWLGSDPGKIDVCFCDGEKAWFQKDIDGYLQFMSPNGVMFLHDVTDPEGPPEAFEYAKSLGYRTELILDKSDTAESLRRAVDGKAAENAYEAWLRHWAGTSCGVGVVWMNKGD